MNMGPVTALGWEIFGRNRSALLLNAAIAAVLGIAIKAGGLAAPMNVLILISFSLLFASAFAYVDLDVRGPRGGFPRHLLVLPLHTWMLALVPIIGGAAFISAFVLLWLRFITGVQLSLIEHVAVAGGITALSCWLQAMSWELVRGRMAKLALLVVAFVLVSVALASLLSEEEMFLGRSGGALALGISLSSGYYFAWLAVIRSRRGDAREPGSSNKRLQTSSWLYFGRSRMPELADGVAAQEWYEGRVFGRLLPVCMLFFCTLFLAMLLFDGVRRIPSNIHIGLVGFTFLLTAPLVGSAYAWKSPQVPRAMLAPFFAVLPLDDVELALAKLKTSAKSHLVGVAIVLGTIAAILLFSENNARVESLWSHLQAHQGTLGTICTVLLAVIFGTVTTWTGGTYTLAASFHFAVVDWRRNGWKHLVAFLGVIAVLKYSGWMHLNRDSIEVLLVHSHTIALALFAISMCFAAVSFRRYAREYPLAPITKLLFRSTGLPVICLVLIWQLNLSMHLLWALSGVAMTLWLSALIPILRMPVLIGMNRHG